MSYSVGDSVNGVVSGVTDYGAFVLLEDGSSGMIHVSKLSHDFVSDIHNVIKKGDVVTATVISVDQGKIALSLIGAGHKKSKRTDFFAKKPKTTDFEEMLNDFKTLSDEKIATVNRRDKRKKR